MKIVADENIPFAKDCFASIGKVVTTSGRAVTAELIKDADALLIRSITKVNAELLNGSAVKFVGTATIGTEHVDQQYLAENKIAFASAPGSNANSVAEYVVSALLNLADKKSFTLNGKSIGIIGVGNVGSKVEQKMRALGMKVFLNDPPLERKTRDDKYRPLHELFDCDIITMHTPLTFEGADKTHHLADEKFFNSLKNGCCFLNTSRGGVVDTSAVKSAIKSGSLAGVVLDVWENEPAIDTELLQMVDFGTPHIAGYSYDGKVAGMIMIYYSLCKLFNIRAKFSARSFVPSPLVEQLEIEGDGEKALLKATNKLYDIKKDDADLRQILSLPSEKQRIEFDDLRKNYSIRREFKNTRVITPGETAEKLKGIGFKVSNA